MKIENVVKIKIPNSLTTEMTICLLGRLVNPKTLHTSNEIEMIHEVYMRYGMVREGVVRGVALQQSFGATIL